MQYEKKQRPRSSRRKERKQKLFLKALIFGCLHLQSVPKSSEIFERSASSANMNTSTVSVHAIDDLCFVIVL